MDVSLGEIMGGVMLGQKFGRDWRVAASDLSGDFFSESVNCTNFTNGFLPQIARKGLDVFSHG